MMGVEQFDNQRDKEGDRVVRETWPLDEEGFGKLRLSKAVDGSDASGSNNRDMELWPLGDVDPKRARFPCCLVWTPLPVVSWLAPFIGHVGIGREDGTILDFSGSNYVNIDDFAFGSVARYLTLDRKKCCFPPNLAAHSCSQGYKHAESGSAITWDDALLSCMRHFQHKSYNLFTCNCHSFVANCLNRLAYGGSIKWNVVTVGALVLFKGRWVNVTAVIRSFLPFISVLCLGIGMAGIPFLVGLVFFCVLLFAWFLLGTYCIKGLVECE